MPEEIVMAFDFGEKRIGVAVGNTVTSRAEPLTTLHVESNQDRLSAVGKLVSEWKPTRFVVGEPAHEDGRPHLYSRSAETIAFLVPNIVF